MAGWSGLDDLWSPFQPLNIWWFYNFNACIKIFNLKKPDYWDCPVSVLLCSSGCQSRSRCTHGLVSREENPLAPTGRLCCEQVQNVQERLTSLRSEETSALSFQWREKGSSTFTSSLLHMLLSYWELIFIAEDIKGSQKSQNFLGWKRPVRSSRPAVNPAESINSLINRFESANI